MVTRASSALYACAILAGCASTSPSTLVNDDGHDATVDRDAGASPPADAPAAEDADPPGLDLSADLGGPMELEVSVEEDAPAGEDAGGPTRLDATEERPPVLADVTSPATPTVVGAIRLLSWNINAARGSGPAPDGGSDPRAHIHAIGTVIRNAAPDIVCLQEVDRGRSDTGGVDQVLTLVQDTGLPRYVFGEVTLRTPRSDGGRRGVAVLSRLPLFNGRTVRLSGDSNYASRPLLLVEAELPTGERVEVACTHFAYSPASVTDPSVADADRDARALSAASLAREVSRYRSATAMGDFNERQVNGAAVADILRAVLQPAYLPLVGSLPGIDAIYTRGAIAPPALVGRTIASPSSDHAPITATLPVRRY